MCTCAYVYLRPAIAIDPRCMWAVTQRMSPRHRQREELPSAQNGVNPNPSEVQKRSLCIFFHAVLLPTHVCLQPLPGCSGWSGGAGGGGGAAGVTAWVPPARALLGAAVLRGRPCSARGSRRGSSELPRSPRSKDAWQPRAKSVLHERACAGWDIPPTR